MSITNAITPWQNNFTKTLASRNNLSHILLQLIETNTLPRPFERIGHYDVCLTPFRSGNPKPPQELTNNKIEPNY